VRLWNRLCRFARRRVAARELEEELRAHRAMAEARLQREGLSADDARHAAARLFGNMTLALQDSRAIWNFAWLESLAQDLRYALHCFCKTPLFAGTVIVTIGLALGLNTALFTAFNAYVLSPFPVQDPYSLYEFWWNTHTTTGRGFSYDEFQHVSEQNPAFADAIAMRRAQVTSGKDLFNGQLVSGNYFSMLGVPPELGRTLGLSDALAPGSNAVIVLSHAAWQSKFGGDPAIIGRRIQLQGHRFEIVGVARRGFTGIINPPADFWAPVTMCAQLIDGPDLFTSGIHPLEVIGRLKPFLTPEQARAASLVFAKQFTAGRASRDQVLSIGLESDATAVRLDNAAGFAPCFIAFILVLLLACANVANIMLARAMARQREIGVRLALGAARPRLVRQLVTEGAVLAVPSAALGCGIAWLAARFGPGMFFSIIPPEFARRIRLLPIELDWRVFLFVFGAAIAATIGFALAPALQATRTDLVQASRGGSAPHAGAGRLRNALVVVQVAICVLLLICTGVLIRGEQRVESLDIGLQVHEVLELDVRPELRTKVLARLESDPVVESIAAVWRTPLYGELRAVLVSTGSGSFAAAGYNFVSPEYFQVFGLPLTRGRNFTADEARGESPVAIVSEATARLFWPHSEALGQTLQLQSTSVDIRADKYPPYATARVIGVAHDAVSGSVVTGQDPTCIYFPSSAAANGMRSFVLRVRGNSEAVRQSLDTSLATSFPNLDGHLAPMQQVLDVQYFPFRVFSWISQGLGILALLLTVVGIYGVIAYLVSQRSREIGIRIALGAGGGRVVNLVLSQSLKLAAVGLVIGFLVSLAAVKILASLLMIHFLDPLVYVPAIATVLFAAVCAAWLPARRASSLDPMSILRHD
jgi:predicted permease